MNNNFEDIDDIDKIDFVIFYFLNKKVKRGLVKFRRLLL